MKRWLLERLLILTCAIVSFAMSSVTPAADSAQPIRAGGLEIFYGVIPAEILLGHPSSHEERQMHGGTPRGRGQHHLIVNPHSSTRMPVGDASNKRSDS